MVETPVLAGAASTALHYRYPLNMNRSGAYHVEHRRPAPL